MNSSSALLTLAVLAVGCGRDPSAYAGDLVGIVFDSDTYNSGANDLGGGWWARDCYLNSGCASVSPCRASSPLAGSPDTGCERRCLTSA